MPDFLTGDQIVVSDWFHAGPVSDGEVYQAIVRCQCCNRMIARLNVTDTGLWITNIQGSPVQLCTALRANPPTLEAAKQQAIETARRLGKETT